MGGEYIHLIGAEDVRRASGVMSEAGYTMQSAANSISDSLARQQTFMNEWLDRFEAILKENKNANN